MVVEVPAHRISASFFGSLVDVWDYPFTDVRDPTVQIKVMAANSDFVDPPGYEGEVPEATLSFARYTYVSSQDIATRSGCRARR